MQQRILTVTTSATTSYPLMWVSVTRSPYFGEPILPPLTKSLTSMILRHWMLTRWIQQEEESSVRLPLLSPSRSGTKMIGSSSLEPMRSWWYHSSGGTWPKSSSSPRSPTLSMAVALWSYTPRIMPILLLMLRIVQSKKMSCTWWCLSLLPMIHLGILLSTWKEPKYPVMAILSFAPLQTNHYLMVPATIPSSWLTISYYTPSTPMAMTRSLSFKDQRANTPFEISLAFQAWMALTRTTSLRMVMLCGKHIRAIRKTIGIRMPGPSKVLFN